MGERDRGGRHQRHSSPVIPAQAGISPPVLSVCHAERSTAESKHLSVNVRLFRDSLGVSHRRCTPSYARPLGRRSEQRILLRQDVCRSLAPNRAAPLAEHRRVASEINRREARLRAQTRQESQDLPP